MLFYKKIFPLIVLILLLIGFAAITSLVSIQIKEIAPGSMDVILYFSSPTVPKYNLSQKGSQLILNLEKVENGLKRKSLDVNKGFLSTIDFQMDAKKEILTLIFNFIGAIPKYNITTKLGSLTLSLNPVVISVEKPMEEKPVEKIETKAEFKLLSVTIDNKFKPPIIILNLDKKEIPSYKTLLLKNPLRFVLDLNNTIDATQKKSFNINVSPFIGLRISQFSKEPFVTRLVFDLKTSFPKVNVKETDQGLVVGTDEILARLPERTISKIEVKPSIEIPEEKPKEIITAPAQAITVPEKKEVVTPKVTDKFQQKITLTFDRADIRDVLKAMGQLVGMNIITDINVQGRISVYLKDVTFKDAFYSLLTASDLGYIQQGDVLIVSTLEKMQKLESRDITTKIFSFKYFDSKKAKDLVSNINKNLIVAVEEDRNWLIVSGPSSELLKIETFVKSLDVPSEKVVSVIPSVSERLTVETIGGNIYLTVNLKGEDIKTILQEIAQKTGKNIFIDKDVSGGIYVTLNRIPVDRALDLIIRGSGFSYELKEGGEILVTKRKEEIVTPTLITKELLTVERIGGKIYVSGELRKVDIKDILKELGKKANINFVIDQKVSGEVEFYVNKVPLEELLSILGKIVNLDMERFGEITYVKMREEKQVPIEIARTKLYTLRYISINDLQRVGGQVVKNINLSYDEKTGLLIAQGKEEDLKVLEELIGKIDVPKKAEEEVKESIRLFVLRYITIDDIQRAWKDLAERLKLSYDPNTKLLLARGSDADIRSLDELISKIDREDVKKPIEAKVTTPLLVVERENNELFVSGELVKTNIKDVIGELARQSQITFVIDPKVNGEINLYLNKVEWSRALELIGLAGKIKIEKKDGQAYYMVYPVEEVKIVETKPQLRTEKKELNYITFEILRPLISDKAKDVTFRYDSRTSTLFMEGPSDQIDEVLKVIKEIDKPTPQVRVDVNVLEVTRGKTKDLGIDWSTGAISSGIKISAPSDWSSLRVSMISAEVSIPAVLKALETQQDAKILAQPSMTTLSEKQTRIMIGDKVPLVTTKPDGTREVSFIDAGIILEVTPKVNPDKTITAVIRPQVSTLSGFVQGVPQISTREAQTTVTLQDGQTLAIGGLIRTEDIESVNKVPILGDIPIIGELFKSKSIKQTDKELVILITLKILE